jgi:hypothetical protein
MVKRCPHLFRFLAAVFLCLITGSIAAGCASGIPERAVSVVWKAALPADANSLYAKDTGEADVLLTWKYLDGLCPMPHFSPSGQKTGEINWALLPKSRKAQWHDGESQTKTGWVAVDEDFTYYIFVSDNGSGSSYLGLDSTVKMISPEGKTVWEAPGLAGMFVFYADDSVVGCLGKDPSLLHGFTREGLEFGEGPAEVKRRYENSETRVLILDTTTGSIRGELGLPSNAYPSTVIRNTSLSTDDMVLSLKREAPPGVRGIVSRVILTRVSDGGTIRSIDMHSVLPKTDVDDVFTSPTGSHLASVGLNGSVSLVDLEGRVLWTKLPRGAGSGPSPDVGAGPVIWSSDGSFLVASCWVSVPGSQSLAVTIFDLKGSVIFSREGLSLLCGARTAPVVLALESTGSSEDFLYVFDMNAGEPRVSRARILPTERFAVSPSGEFVLVLRKTETGAGPEIIMYRIGP